MSTMTPVPKIQHGSPPATVPATAHATATAPATTPVTGSTKAPTTTTASDPASAIPFNPAPASEASPQPKIVMLQVGEHRFNTTLSTLTSGSEYFGALFSGRWADDMLEDGSYFIDADGEMFSHILAYLRHGTYPLFWNQSFGFDYDRYIRLEKCATSFMVEPLTKWISEKRYLRAVSVATTMSCVLEDDVFPKNYRDTSSGDDNILDYKIEKGKKWVYTCPRNIPCHATRDKCGRECAKVHDRLLNDDSSYDSVDAEDVYRVMQTRRTVSVIDSELVDGKH